MCGHPTYSRRVDEPRADRTPDGPMPLRDRVLLAVGFGLHVMILYFYLVAGLVVPAPYLFLLWIAWVALLVLAIRLRNNPWYVFATPFIGAALWIAVVLGLGSILDWQA